MKHNCLTMLLLFLACSLSVQAQKKKELEIPVAMNYCLPKVVYQLDVSMECTRFIPGPLRQYAEKELHLNPGITRLEEVWSVKDIKVSPGYVPDTKATYSISAKGSYNPLTLSLTGQGFLAGVSLKVAGKSMAAAKEMEYEAGDVLQDRIDILKARNVNHMKEVLDSNFTFQEIDGEMKKIWDPIVHYAAKDPADYARELAAEIYRIRSERMKLLSSENGVPDGKSLELILDEFNRMESDYMSLFMGKTVRTTVHKTVSCVPLKPGSPVVAFRFSAENGMVSPKDVTAEPYMLDFSGVVVPAQADPQESEAAGEAGVSSCLYYRVPATCRLYLMKGKEVLKEMDAVIPQFGVIKKFPLEVVSNENLSLEFHPCLGALKQIKKN